MINPGNILLYKAPGNTLANSIAEWNEELLNFSSCGKIPYTIPELLAEVTTPDNNIL